MELEKADADDEPKLEYGEERFGDFFLSAIVSEPCTPIGTPKFKMVLVVAHGTPWCTSRFSGFHIDLLSPGLNPK